MERKKNIFNLRLINALLFISLFLVQYNGVLNIKIFTATPMLTLALLVAICMFCSELRGALTGLVVGVFIDTVASTPQGFNAIIFCVLSLISVLITKYLFNNNILSALTLCALCSMFYFIIRWIFCLGFSLSFTENLTYIMGTVFPSVLYTCVFIIPFYYLEKFLYKRFFQ
ncbi:MAG: rod shape-determining protein MreD [Clostridia bacterium]|nr:rod shape-determining protein MreD [Clostridia bacterium]